MVNQDNRSLLELLQEVSNLPEYIRSDAVKNIIAEWRRKSPLVDEVVSGRTTFERVITDLVEENRQLTFLNRKGACNTPQFEVIVKETAAKFAGVLPLSNRRLIPRVGIVGYDLTEKVNWWSVVGRHLKFNIGMILAIVLFVWGLSATPLQGKWALITSIGLGLLFATVSIFTTFPFYILDRRQMALEILRQARFLDSMLGPQRT